MLWRQAVVVVVFPVLIVVVVAVIFLQHLRKLSLFVCVDGVGVGVGIGVCNKVVNFIIYSCSRYTHTHRDTHTCYTLTHTGRHAHGSESVNDALNLALQVFISLIEFHVESQWGAAAEQGRGSG